MDKAIIKSTIETIIFVSDTAVTVDELFILFDSSVSKDEITNYLKEIADEYSSRAINLVEIADGFRFQTLEEYGEYVKKFFKLKKGERLGRASLETLAIIAYRQPITRAEIDTIRGVDSGHSLKLLVERDLIKSLGVKQVLGQPILYGTTKKFLEYFGLAKLSDMPTLEEIANEFDEKNKDRALPGFGYDPAAEQSEASNKQDIEKTEEQNSIYTDATDHDDNSSSDIEEFGLNSCGDCDDREKKETA